MFTEEEFDKRLHEAQHAVFVARVESKERKILDILSEIDNKIPFECYDMDGDEIPLYSFWNEKYQEIIDLIGED